jgi:putative redox protein
LDCPGANVEDNTWILRKPGMAVQAQLKWADESKFIARAGNGPAVVVDSRDSGSGPSPMELVLIGVAGCTAIDVISIMKKKRVNLTGFHVNITGEHAEEHPKRYTNIHIEYIFHGKGIKSKAVEQAIRLSETKFCSAMASLNAEFEHAYRIVEGDEPA